MLLVVLLPNMRVNIPVLLITYKRPDLTENLINILIKNNIEDIFIYMDGPNNSSDMANCKKTRKIIEMFSNKYPNIKTLFKDKNVGIAHGIPEAIDWVFKSFNQAIILEDDCIPSSKFFPFMEQMLIRYKPNSEIASICGSNFLSKWNLNKENYFYSKYFNSWGWGTWKDRWQRFDRNLDNLDKIQKNKFLKTYLGSYRAYFYWHWILSKVKNRKIDTWDYTWIFTNFINKKLHITPKINLVSNIGIGLDSSHTKSYPVNYIPSSSISDEFNLSLPAPLNIVANHKFDKDVENKIYSKSIQNRIFWILKKIFKY